MSNIGVNQIQKEINKIHGESALVALGDRSLEIDRIPTGIIAVDEILGGGFPIGKMVELYGNPGGGKTSIAMKFIAEAQKRGKCVLIDLENAFDPHVARNSGINIPELLLAQPETAEGTLDVVERLIKANDVATIVIDSVAGMTPRAEIEGDFGDSHVGLVARLLSQGMRKINAELRSADSPIIIVWVNQIREKIGMMGYGPSTESTGGRALKFWCSTRLEVSRTGAVKQGEDIIGHTVKVKAVKSRFAAPYQVANFDVLYETGISNESTLLDLAVNAGLIVKGGAWFTFVTTGEKIQGRAGVIEILRNDKDIYTSILESVSTGQ
jgi:recombination protein RecA